MAVDSQKLLFSSADPADKIIFQDTVTIVNNGATSDYSTAKIQTSAVTNTYGRQLFARFVWSLDGGSLNSQETRLNISYTITVTPPGVTSSPAKGLKAAVAIGVNNSQIIFKTANGDHGNVTSIDGGATYQYTPVSHSFLIKYALFEVI